MPIYCYYLLLLEILAVHPLRASIVRPQHRLNSNRLLNLLSEVCPLPLRSSTLVCKLSKVRLVRPIVTNIPNRPPSRVDHLRQLRVLEHDSREVPPRPPQVIHTVTHGVSRRGRHTRPVDDVPAGVVRHASGRRDPARGRAYDAEVAVLEPGLRALPEDEVRRALDVGFSVELGAKVGEQSVLVAVEGAGIVTLSLCLGSVVSEWCDGRFFRSSVRDTYAGLRADRNGL